MTTSSEADFKRTKAESWLNCNNNKNYTTSLAKDDKWVIYNMQMAGLFRVLYDTRNWMGIVSTLNDPNEFNKIHTLNRVQLIDDAFSFSQIGDIDYGITFQLLRYLKHENEYLPWSAAMDGLGQINKIFRRTPNQGMFQSYMQRMLSSIFSRFRDMTAELKGFEEIRFRNLVIAEACRHRMKECTDQALMLFKTWMKSIDPDNNNVLPIELKTLIYCQAIKYGGADEFEFLWERYQRSNVAAEKAKILSALGCSTETWLLNRYLNSTIGNNAIIRKQDASSVFYSVASSDFGFYIAKEFLYHRIADISKYFEPRGDRVGKYVYFIGSQMKSHKELNEIQTFINSSSNYLKGAESLLKLTIETVNVNIELTSKYYQKIVNHLV